ncbi:MAG: hypothetical protein P4L79_07910 [Legionella sp.]|uniref:hypothetical protein n=1 Tax=Legionella sp. TaxID=459 RepID=UPI0028497D66|nr:hypothetical protein [Legionella sp.]
MKIFNFAAKKSDSLYEQAIPIALTVAVFGALAVALLFVVRLLNLLPTGSPISENLRWGDIVVGATIYFKTSVDFAILIGYLMRNNPGWKNRIAIELGTALGNGAGTILILSFWVVFKQLHFLLALMILLSALVLFEMAESGVQHFDSWRYHIGLKHNLYKILKGILDFILKFTKPVTSRILPNFSKTLSGNRKLKWTALMVFALTTPFILGLDDFAGYVPLFSVVNVFGFAVGVIGAHMILNIGLFANPDATIKFFKNQWISFIGAVAFLGLAFWGLIEAVRILV